MPYSLPPGVIFSIAIVMSTGLALLYPHLFTRWGTFETKAAVIPLLQFIMFVMGTRVSLGGLRQVLVTPKPIAIGLGLQWLVMPFLVAGLAMLFALPADVGAGVVLVGSVCAGNSSNVMTYFAGGNLALAVTMTTLSTLLTPVVTPMLMQLLVGRVVPVDSVALSWSIVKIVVAPMTAGLVCERLLRGHKEMAERWLPRFVIAATCLVNAIITANSREALLTIGLALVAVELLHNVSGYAVGYGGALLFGLDARDSTAMAMQVGIRNGGLATGLAYDVLHSGNAALASVVFGAVQNASGALMASVLRKRLERTT